MAYPHRLILLAVFPFSVMAQTLSGTVYTGGAPTANLTFEIRGPAATQGTVTTRVTTNARGDYSVNLTAGRYVLIIRGTEIQVTVDPNGTRRDIRL